MTGLICYRTVDLMGTDVTFPDGYCSQSCVPGFVAEICGDAACVGMMGVGWCLATCEPATPDCRSGYACRESPWDPGVERYCVPDGLPAP
jgi:hypothetical protein